ncbi:MAG TPA: YSC84-related protein [Acetobacteraceae bacterium]|jgi:SH3 domain-containing YSC84-like protein 1|nr:YSC84-related protein [Acetobacteraceae bacterium]
MRRFLLTAVALAATLAPGLAHAQGEPQTLVDRATLSLQEMMTASDNSRAELTHARAVVICPRIFKAGFFFGGSGGDCVLVARAGNGTWSYPTFYTIGSGSFGLQIGIEDSSLVMMILTPRGLNAVLDSQFKLGANASIAVATLGGGVGGATTAAVGADIVAFNESRGLFGGISLEGSLMSLLSTWNAAYYGQPYSARQVVIQMMGANPGANPLREVLTRYGTPGAMQVAVPPPPPPGYAAPGYSPPGGQGYPPPQGPGYGGPPQGYAPPAQSYNAPPQGYPPQEQGNGPSPQGYPPQGQGYASGQGYAPNGPGGYAPAYPPANQYGGGSQDQGGQPVQLTPNGPVQQQSLPPPSR